MPKKLTTQQFIEKAKEIHGSTYDYSLVDYIGRNYKIKIICPEHNIFEQRPANHVNGFGCKKCADKNKSFKYKLTTESFVNKAKQVHGNLYDYSFVNYADSQTKIKILCTEHGMFEQSPNNHLSNQGCPVCGRVKSLKIHKENPTGWKHSSWVKAAETSKNFDSFKVYIIRCWNDEEEFYKIGKTYRTVENRFSKSKYMPYNYDTIKIFEGKAKEISRFEKQLQKENKKYKYIPKIKFNGMYECFKNVSYE